MGVIMLLLPFCCLCRLDLLWIWSKEDTKNSFLDWQENEAVCVFLASTGWIDCSSSLREMPANLLFRRASRYKLYAGENTKQTLYVKAYGIHLVFTFDATIPSVQENRSKARTIHHGVRVDGLYLLWQPQFGIVSFERPKCEAIVWHSCRNLCYVGVGPARRSTLPISFLRADTKGRQLCTLYNPGCLNATLWSRRPDTTRILWRVQIKKDNWHVY